MIRGVDTILLSSQDAAKLAKFYKEKVGLKPSGEYEMGEKGEGAYIYEWKGKSALCIMDHSKVKGKSKNPERYLINFEVDDIKKEVVKLKRNKVRVVQDTYHMEGYGWVATFEDSDGNYFQLVQVKAS